MDPRDASASKNEQTSKIGKKTKKWRKLQQKAHVQPGSLKKEFLGYL